MFRSWPWLLRTLEPAVLAERLGVDPRTVRRWKREGLPPGPARAALEMLDGGLGWFHPAWTGWWVDPQGGALFAPNGERFSPGDVAALRLDRQRIAALLVERRDFARELQELRVELAAGQAKRPRAQVVAHPALAE